MTGTVGKGKKGPLLAEATTICGLSPAEFRDRTPFADLVAINPDRRFRLGDGGYVSMRLVDSLTRMGRAFNQHGSGSGRTLSGGLESRALEIPRRFFGLARNVEHGGSVTVIATALVETGSRMDDLIFEEFKGTGNRELVLDRRLADQRIFPAIDMRQSGTRRDELLYDDEEFAALTMLCRGAAAAAPMQAMAGLLRLIEKHPTNQELLRSLRPA